MDASGAGSLASAKKTHSQRLEAACFVHRAQKRENKLIGVYLPLIPYIFHPLDGVEDRAACVCVTS